PLEERWPGLVEQLLDALQRNFHPTGPVIKFVSQFIERLFHQVNVEQRLQMFWIPRQKAALTSCRQVASQERRRRPWIPEVRKGIRRFDGVWPHPHARDLPQFSGVRG